MRGVTCAGRSGTSSGLPSRNILRMAAGGWRCIVALALFELPLSGCGIGTPGKIAAKFVLGIESGHVDVIVPPHRIPLDGKPVSGSSNDLGGTADPGGRSNGSTAAAPPAAGVVGASGGSGGGGSSGGSGGGPALDVALTTVERFTVERFAGSAGPGQPAGASRADVAFGGIGGVVVGADGTVYASDTENHRILAIPEVSDVSIAAGSGGGAPGFLGDNIPATAERLNRPTGLTRDELSGAIILCDTGNNRVRTFAPGGRIYTLAGGGADSGDTVNAAINAALDEPVAVALDGAGVVYFTERGAGRIRSFAPGGGLQTVSAFPPDTLGALTVAPEGDRVWCGAGSDVWLVRPGSGQPPTVLVSRPGQTVSGLVFDRQQRLYVAWSSEAQGMLVERVEVDATGARQSSPTDRVIAGGGAPLPPDPFAMPMIPMPDATLAAIAPGMGAALCLDMRALLSPDPLPLTLYYGCAAPPAPLKGLVVRLTQTVEISP